MDQKSAPSLSDFMIAVSGLVIIAGLGIVLIVLMALFPVPTVMLGAACVGCATLFSGVRFISRILDPRDARRPPDQP